MKHNQIEIEVKFLVPKGARADVVAEVARGGAAVERSTLAARYLDTPGRHLAREGLSWRLRREGRRWIQTVKSARGQGLERFEHEVIRPDGSHDASAHADTPVGARLMALLRRAGADGQEPVVRFETEVRRTARRLRTRGALVDIALDEGRLRAGERGLTIREIEFELASGSTTALLALAERWRKRFGLVLDPRSKSERGDSLAQGRPFPAVRKAVLPAYAEGVTALQAFTVVLDECLAQITRNAIGLVDGDPAQRVDHVHQLRVGIRRLRCALRSFEGWVPTPPGELVAGLRALFATLGRTRDSDVLDTGVVAELKAVGAPSLTLPAPAVVPDVAGVICADDTQRCLLAWLAWRAALDEVPSRADDQLGSQADPAAAPAAPAPAQAPAAELEQRAEPVMVPDAAGAAEAGAAAAGLEAADYLHLVERRLHKWHARIVADRKAFNQLDEAELHDLRKRIKRQRYAVEFFAPVLRRRRVVSYLSVLSELQSRMGELTDLFVARVRYQGLVASDPAAWFALGWLAARIAERRAAALPALERLARTKPPTA